jgi:uncharacterized protein involved in exopolysaccharide biosynthesis
MAPVAVYGSRGRVAFRDPLPTKPADSVTDVDKRFAWIRSWWFVVLVILLIAVGLAVALIDSGSNTGY